VIDPIPKERTVERTVAKRINFLFLFLIKKYLKTDLL